MQKAAKLSVVFHVVPHLAIRRLQLQILALVVVDSEGSAAAGPGGLVG